MWEHTVKYRKQEVKLRSLHLAEIENSLKIVIGQELGEITKTTPEDNWP